MYKNSALLSIGAASGILTVLFRCRPCIPDREETGCPHPDGRANERNSEPINQTSIEYANSLWGKDWSVMQDATASPDQEKWRQLGLATQVTDRIRQLLVGKDWSVMQHEQPPGSGEMATAGSLNTEVQRRQQVCCSALVSPRWSFLAPEGCDTLTGITRRRQESSLNQGLGPQRRSQARSL